MKKLYNFLKVKLCYRTYWKQWLAFFTLLLVIILGSENADYTTKRVLEYDREKAVERIKLAKEKDSLENIKIRHIIIISSALFTIPYMSPAD